MINGVDYKVGTPTAEQLPAIQQLRHEVLDPAKAQPTELKLSDKDWDPATIHVAAFIGDKVVSAARLDSLGHGVYSVRKMATAERHRGHGIGGAVLSYGEAMAWQQGGRSFTLDSRLEAIEFYRHLGYVETGDEVMHTDGIPNYTMIKEGMTGGR